MKNHRDFSDYPFIWSKKGRRLSVINNSDKKGFIFKSLRTSDNKAFCLFFYVFKCFLLNLSHISLPLTYLSTTTITRRTFMDDYVSIIFLNIREFNGYSFAEHFNKAPCHVVSLCIV